MNKISELFCSIKNNGNAGFVLLVMVLLFNGCTAGKDGALHKSADGLQVESAADAQNASGASDTAPPEPLQKGFVLKEKVDLGINARRDFNRAVDFLHNEEYDSAATLLENVIEDSPKVTAPYINLAMAYRKLDKPEKAEDLLKIALKLFPKHPVASNEYGLLLRAGGRFAEARDVYETTLQKYPEYLPARKNLGILCDLYLNDPASALAQYEKYHQIKPDDKQVKLWISEIRLRLGS
ncbi:tetratricopeptide repeat protein [Desulfosediminicola ganghwensis]|uniref:tetratricopeptide repeat protein n=1 Tax=Desulfosediminicola ganghwensis TaxID=2569540 RepID=UPI0010AD0B25|nr:tetratricopeptide repeat protein [Desulfosediminicola ganghwensis]